MTAPYSGTPFPLSASFQLPGRIVNLSGLSAICGPGAPAPCSILMIVSGGSGSIEIDGNQHVLTAGSMLCCSSSLPLSLNAQFSLQGVWIEYTSVTRPGDADASPLNNGRLHSSAPAAICSLACRLLQKWNEPSEDNPFAVQLLFTELLAGLYKLYTQIIHPQEHWLDRILQYIDEHYNEDLTRAQLAELVQVSPEHFSRTFRKATGRSFSEYLTLQRIRRVQQRLLTETQSLSTLALEVGYSEGTYLSRKFKQVVGVSPAVYHRKAKRIASLNFNHTASLRALEIVPELGVYSGWMKQLELVPAYPGLRAEGTNGTDLYRSVAAVKPDVIISYTLPGGREQLLPVAPVIELSYMQMGWREQFIAIADITGRKLRAEEWLSRYDELCCRYNRELDRLIGPRGTAVAWEVGGAAAYCYSSSYGHGSQILYGDLGFSPPAALLKQGLLGQGYLETAIEHLPDYNADHIFITSGPSTPAGHERFSNMLLSPRWQTLAAVRNNRVYLVDQTEMFYGFDPLSSLAQLNTLMQSIRSQIYMGHDHIRP
ncbi:helix-turn-helix domain-containing protein [Paenibacillus sp. FSL R7-0331]|uniref:helix-turn-helix domain-containing protein n=1 Tax=Paenibacillus sp. FSL R7-0331 TaxID=1536773 RepID=UPI0005A892C1|nr:helix-turn-helix domain-containing protein [Paenibacillus sp. FSL R7-0331]